MLVALRPATELIGRVVDEAGHGLGGARLTLFVLSRAYREEGRGDVRADADGRFALWLDPLQVAHRLRAEAPGRAAVTLWLPDGALGRRFELGELVLTRPRSIAGQVTVAEGERPPTGVRASWWRDDPGQPSGWQAQGPDAMVRGDAQGRFRFRVVAPGSYHLLLEAPRRRMVVLPVAVGRSRNVDLAPVVLPPAIRMAGQVVDGAGQPPARALARARGRRRG